MPVNNKTLRKCPECGDYLDVVTGEEGKVEYVCRCGFRQDTEQFLNKRGITIKDRRQPTMGRKDLCKSCGKNRVIIQDGLCRKCAKGSVKAGRVPRHKIRATITEGGKVIPISVSFEVAVDIRNIEVKAL